MGSDGSQDAHSNTDYDEEVALAQALAESAAATEGTVLPDQAVA